MIGYTRNTPPIPSGGAAGQVLAKTTADDYATEWIDPPAGGEFDARAAIMATAPDGDAVAYSTDTLQAYLHTADQWLESSAIFTSRSGPADIGAFQSSSLTGYGPDYVTDKQLSNVAIGSNADKIEGGIRTLIDERTGERIAQYYLNGAWQTALTGVTLRVNRVNPSIETLDFEPWAISVTNGNSVTTDPSGVPMVQNFKIDMGAFSAPLVIDGGSF